MPSSWTQNFYHAVYSTKHRTPWITPDVEERLHPFLGGIAKDLKCTPIAINGMAEHVHVLLRFPSDLAVCNLVRDLKARSSKWIHQALPNMREFAWQDGYGGFTVSKPSVEAVEQYIRTQKEHHQTMSFEVEYLSMLHRPGGMETRMIFFCEWGPLARPPGGEYLHWLTRGLLAEPRCASGNGRAPSGRGRDRVTCRPTRNGAIRRGTAPTVELPHDQPNVR